MERYRIKEPVQADRPDGMPVLLARDQIVTPADVHRDCLLSLVATKRAERLAGAEAPSVSGPAKAPEVQAKKK